MTEKKPCISLSSLNKIARKVGIKSLSEDCHDAINEAIQYKMNQIIEIASEISTHRNRKILLLDDLHFALETVGINIAKTTGLE